MTRRSSSNIEKPAPAESDVKVTPESSRIESPVIDTTVKNTDPINLEITTPDTEATTPATATPPEKIQTDVREKLAKKSTEENVFVPANPAALEKAAGEVAKEKGFDLNRGTSIGARLMARAGKSI